MHGNHSNMLLFSNSFKVTESNFVERGECSNNMDPTLPLCLARWNLQAAPIFLGDGKFDIPEVPVQKQPFFLPRNFTVRYQVSISYNLSLKEFIDLIF